MADIFISYAREDRQRASVLADALEGCGYSVWWDRQQVPGQAFDEVIERQLEACKVVIVCWSDDATASAWVKAEASLALDHEKYVPVLFQMPCKLPFLFAPYHAEDFSDWDGEREALGFTLLRQALSPFVDTVGCDAEELPVLTTSENTLPPSKQVFVSSEMGFREELPLFVDMGRYAEELATVATSKSGQPPLSSRVFVAPEMALIRAGSIVTGSDAMPGWSAEPKREVYIETDFEIGVCPVSFEEYACFTEAANYDMPDDNGWGRENRPVINVSWQDAIDYSQWLSEKTGLRFRLPTASEWEYACRAGSATRFWWGDEPGRGNANFVRSGSEWSDKTSPLKSFKPNPFGLYDTSGNVWEWVQDIWHDSCIGGPYPVDGYAYLDADSNKRLLRGGSWLGNAAGAASAALNIFDRGYRVNYVGFRLARTL